MSLEDSPTCLLLKRSERLSGKVDVILRQYTKAVDDGKDGQMRYVLDPDIAYGDRKALRSAATAKTRAA